ncbi:putative enzyme related to lactoylglutathione lyase [Sphingobium xanthum]|jgi:predicted enzyme related to lactoylglutathione lyase|uniref:VOC family protein n=1 Tax=Sphingobium xanthum TaxID=1387165 RepID=UPI001C8B6B53|nr:VOC family protein [Sphingobium xanthum]
MAVDFDGGLTLSMRATDLDRTIAWYQTVLGFTLLYRAEQMAWCELATPVGKVNVGFSESETVMPGGAVPTWGVTDIVAAQAMLAEHGVRTDGDIQHIPGLVKLLTFYDPDDNAMMFYETDGAPA